MAIGNHERVGKGLERAARIGLSLKEFADLKRWLAEVGERPAVKRGMAVMG